MESRLLETFQVEAFDELSERRLRQPLRSAHWLGQPLWVHPEFAGHLDMGVGESAPPLRLGPDLQLVCRFFHLRRFVRAVSR